MKLALLEELQVWRRERRPCAVVTQITSGAAILIGERFQVGELSLTDEQVAAARTRIATDRSGLLDEQLFVRVYAPPLRLIIVGAVHITAALVPVALIAGFDVTIVDPREMFVGSGQMKGLNVIAAWPDEAMATLCPDERTAVVALTHDPKLDDPALSTALQTRAFYVGALGSRKTHAARVERLTAVGIPPAEIERIHGPIGLDIHALTPAEIAISIVAEIVATLRAEPV